MKLLNIADIRIDGGTQTRVKLIQEKVDEYAELMKDGIKFPPVVVFYDGKDYWMSAGFHRYFGNRKIGNTTIECEVIEGTVRDAKLYAYGANKHGLPHSPEENRLIVLELLKDPEWCTWTNAQIAKHIGISAMTVGRIKKANEVVEPEEKTYVNKHGQESKIKTKNLGKKKETKRPTTKPDVSSADFNEADDKIKELSHTIEELADENTLLRDKIAIGQMDASEIEKIYAEETIANLREQLRVAHIEIASLRDSRDMFQIKYAEAVKVINSIKKKYKVKE